MEKKDSNRLQRVIVITGTESTGKTELAEWLGAAMDVPVIQDVTRQYCQYLQRQVTADDVYDMATAIIQKEDNAVQQSSVVVTDNCLLNIRIWLRYNRWPEPAWLTNAINDRQYGLYLLCYPDIPWQRDPLRNNPHDRLDLYVQFETALKQRNATYLVVNGHGEKRYNQALNAINTYLTEK